MPTGGILPTVIGFMRNQAQWVAFKTSWRDQDGDYDDHSEWRDAYWWHENDRDWYYSSHLEWAASYPQWRDEDGAYDQQHVWCYGQWWYQQQNNHPAWVEENPAWSNPVDMHNYQQQQA
jgi:hypothetical protein